jgi:hypothetical protein
MKELIELRRNSGFTSRLARRLVVLAGALGALCGPLPAGAQFVTGLAGGSGSTVGPGGDIYVTENLAGRVSRVNPRTGEVSTFAESLPPAALVFGDFGIGGAVDVEFIGSTAYVLVAMVGFPFGGSIDGIYRVDGPSTFTIIADIGAWSAANPPSTPFDLPQGVQFAMEPYRGGFLVSDGHHNRVLWVTRDGEISEVHQFGNIVPTGLEVQGNTIHVAQAGASPHVPADGKIVALTAGSSTEDEIASGAPLLVDVERGRGITMFGLSQGIWDGLFPGSPAMPDTGSLVQLDDSGGFTTVATGLDRPSSMQIIGNTAYVVTLDGEVWKIPNIASPPFGRK